MRKIHLPTSIKQTKFVSRIQAYRSSVYLQGFRGFTFASTQSRQTKAESYVKCEAESSRCHKTISSTKNFFHQTDGKSIISLSSGSSFPSPTPFMRAVLSFTQFHLIDIFIVICWKVLFCVRLLHVVCSHKRFIRMEKHSNVFISILLAYPQNVYCTKLEYFFIRTSSSPCLNWVYFGSRNNFSITRARLLLPRAHTITIWNLLFMVLCKRTSADTHNET